MLSRMGGDFTPGEYWSKRLQADFNLRGTGHASYSEGYNEWLYRAKRRALRGSLGRTGLQGGPALDVGSGTGWCVEQLQAGGFEVTGCDITQESVDGLEYRYPESDFFQLEIGRDEVPLSAGTQCLVTALDVLYHVVDDQLWSTAISEISRVLAPGGYAIVTDGFGPCDQEPAQHVQFRSRDRWIAEAERHDLRLYGEIPLYRWLSRNRKRGVCNRVPDGARGFLEYALERVAPRKPNLWCVTFQKRT